MHTSKVYAISDFSAYFNIKQTAHWTGSHSVHKAASKYSRLLLKQDKSCIRYQKKRIRKKNLNNYYLFLLFLELTKHKTILLHLRNKLKMRLVYLFINKTTNQLCLPDVRLTHFWPQVCIDWNYFSHFTRTILYYAMCVLLLKY